MKTRLLAPLLGVVLAAVAPAGCDRPTTARQPDRAPAVSPSGPTPVRTVATPPAPASEPHPGEAAWAGYFKALADVGRPCDEVMNALARAPRARDRAAVRQLARSAEGACFTASGGYGAVTPPDPLSAAGRRDLERGVSTLSKAYLGRSLGLNALAEDAPVADAAVSDNPEAAQTLGHAQDDIVAARARLVAVARRHGYAHADDPDAFEPVDPPAPKLASLTRPARLAAWPPRAHDRAAAHRTATGRWRVQDRRLWSPPPYPRFVAAPCDLGAPLSPQNCAHAYRNAEVAHAEERRDEARPSRCRRFWILPCRLFGRGGRSGAG